MEFVLLLIIGLSLGIVFYATRSKPVQDKLQEHIKAAEVIIASEIKEDVAKIEVAAEELKKDVQQVSEEIKTVASEVKVAGEEVKVVIEEVKEVATKPKKAPKSPAKAEVAAKRTRKGGKFVGDDKTTVDVNEAFKDGKTPPKKPKSTKKKA